MGLPGYGAEGHGPSSKTFDNFGGRLHLVQGHGFALRTQLHEPAQGHHAFALFVYLCGELAVFVGKVPAHGMLKIGDGFGRPYVVLATQTKGVFPAHIQGIAIDMGIAIGLAVPFQRLFRHLG